MCPRYTLKGHLETTVEMAWCSSLPFLHSKSSLFCMVVQLINSQSVSLSLVPFSHLSGSCCKTNMQQLISLCVLVFIMLSCFISPKSQFFYFPYFDIFLIFVIPLICSLECYTFSIVSCCKRSSVNKNLLLLQNGSSYTVIRTH